MIFEGEYKNGKRNGKGKEYENDKCIFYGEYLDGDIWEGIGIEIEIENDFKYAEGEIYELEYLDGMIQNKYKLGITK